MFPLLLSQTIDYGVNKYDIGTGFGQFGVATQDVSTNNVIYQMLHITRLIYNDHNLL